MLAFLTEQLTGPRGLRVSVAEPSGRALHEFGSPLPQSYRVGDVRQGKSVIACNAPGFVVYSRQARWGIAYQR
jgi:hypothetical protein